MNRIPLQTLPTFRAVAQLSSLRAAAEQLHLTHSAISQQIRLLEDQLGFQLFDRRGRRVVLNTAGTVLLAAVESALAQLDEAVRAAGANDTEHRLRITVLPSFAQHWLLPRMPRWRERHPDIAVELHTSPRVLDLKRDGYHAAMRQGRGPWRGLDGTCLIDTPLIAVGSAELGRRLVGCDPSVFLDEALLGHADRWERWFALAGHPARVKPVAIFNDMGMLVQAAEQGMGIALCRELVAADALRDGRLVRLSPLALSEPGSDTFWLLHPPELAHWPPMRALRDWLQAELKDSSQQLQRGLDDVC
jgi:LysR family glycine cleavage system transcriptional activator